MEIQPCARAGDCEGDDMTDLAKLRELANTAASPLAGPPIDAMWELWQALPALLDEVEALQRANALMNIGMSVQAEQVEKLRAALLEIVERADEPCSGIARKALGETK